MNTAKEIASAMDVEQVFKQNRNRRRKRQFDYESTDEGTLSAEQAFRTGYFLCIIDKAITSMNTRLEQLQQYDTLFWFLYNINTMRQLNDDDLLKCCVDLDLRYARRDHVIWKVQICVRKSRFFGRLCLKV